VVAAIAELDRRIGAASLNQRLSASKAPRGGITSATAEGRWRRLVDGLAAAGGSRAVRLQRAEKQAQPRSSRTNYGPRCTPNLMRPADAVWTIALTLPPASWRNRVGDNASASTPPPATVADLCIRQPAGFGRTCEIIGSDIVVSHGEALSLRAADHRDQTRRER
jgi:hypothetical protein